MNVGKTKLFPAVAVLRRGNRCTENDTFQTRFTPIGTCTCSSVLSMRNFNLNGSFLLCRLPDSPFELDQLAVVRTDPLIIPLDDVSGKPVFIYNYEDIPWPESNGNQPATPTFEFSTTRTWCLQETQQHGRSNYRCVV